MAPILRAEDEVEMADFPMVIDEVGTFASW
jgi:hypothetical protein